MLHRLALAGMIALTVVVVACRTTTFEPGQLEIDRIAVVGHGTAFDENMREMPMDIATIQSMQESLRDALGKPGRFGRNGNGFAADIEKAIASAGRPEERALLTGVLINWQLERADRRLREPYGWKNRFLTERTRALLDLRERGRWVPSEALKRLLREGWIPLSLAQTDYMAECRAQDVPVPPNFSMRNPRSWVNQGNLTRNMLKPGEGAQVWTWTDPARRGACVALPREYRPPGSSSPQDIGGPGSVAGIICQSATTGKACFWDNLSREDPGGRIPAATETLVIRNLQDGRTLDVNEPCTRCHTGNNVFLMAPDDATWAKLMRGPMTAGNFSTVFEPLANTVADGPRYTPIAHAEWVNPPLRRGCAMSCHGMPSASVQALTRPPMPPACAGGNFRNCYAMP